MSLHIISSFIPCQALMAIPTDPVSILTKMVFAMHFLTKDFCIFFPEVSCCAFILPSLLLAGY